MVMQIRPTWSVTRTHQLGVVDQHTGSRRLGQSEPPAKQVA